MSFSADFLVSPQKRFLIGIATWIVLTVTGFGVLAIYSNTPGAIGAPPPLSLSSLPVAQHVGKHLLVMAIHPKCPCTRASIGELARILRYAEDKMDCLLLVYQPIRAGVDWQETSLVASAKQQIKAELIYDEAGRLAKQLGMATSGSVILYSPNGDPMFHGGITPSRNHHGDNIGSDSILAIMNGETPLAEQVAVYGCPIHAETNSCSVDEEMFCGGRQP